MSILRLHPDTIEAVKQRVDIVDLVSERVVLRKRGREFVGLCPFHEEKSPSFTVSPAKQMYYCFGCGAGGNGITFLTELDKRSFSEVVLDLARRYNLSVKTLEPEKHQEFERQLSLKQQLYEILAVTASFYQHALRQQEGKQALEYLKSSRKLSEQTIQQFQLGYAPAGWQTLYHYLIEVKSYSVKLVEQVGAIAPRKKGSGYYDRFRERLIIPICDPQGRIVGFGGRTLSDEEPKYLNSPETPVFDKGKTLFALDKAKNAIAKQDRAVIVEGYFDAIALHAAGITNVVASLGTALSADQIKQLLRYSPSKQVILNFDADAAGTKAAERAIGEIANLAYKGQVQLRVLNLPQGKDADDFLKISGTPEPYRQLLADAPLWIDWQIQQIFKNRNLKQADDFQQATAQLIELLGQLENSTSRTYYCDRSAQLLSQGNSRLAPQLARDLLAQLKKPRRRQDKREEKKTAITLPVSREQTLLQQAESLLLRVYLHCPDYRPEIIRILADKGLKFIIARHQFLWSQILTVRDSLAITSPELISKLQDEYLPFPHQVSRVQTLFHLDEKTRRDIGRAPLIIKAATACMERTMCEQRSRYALERWEKTNPHSDPQSWQFYYNQFYQAKQRIMEIDKCRQVTLLDLIQQPWEG